MDAAEVIAHIAWTQGARSSTTRLLGARCPYQKFHLNRN